MKNKNILTIGVVCLFVFTAIAAYLWYIYFHEYEQKLIDASPAMRFIKGVELINSGNINYVNANATDDENMIPTYYFSVKNHSDKNYNYVILLEDTEGNDGCSSNNLLTRNELEYELTLDNEVLKSGDLNSLSDNVLDTNIIRVNETKDYSLKIKLKETAVNYEGKHFHYIINMQEQ